MSEWEYAVGSDPLDLEQRFDVPPVRYIDPIYLASLAEVCAEDFFGNHDGWENTWPLVFVLYRNGKEMRRYQVTREDRPYFYADPIQDATA